MPFIPNAEGNKVTWYKNYLLKLPAMAIEFNMLPEEVARQKAKIEQAIDQIAKAQSAMAVQKMENSLKRSIMDETDSIIKTTVARFKTDPKWTPAHNKELQTDTAVRRFDAINYQPTLEWNIIANQVLLGFKKIGVDGMNIYTRLRGEATWVLLAHVTRSPFTDPRAISTPGIAEIREYMIIGVIADKEIGQPSDVITVIFGG